MSFTITRFEIKSISTEFYGNGNQQIRVNVEVLKERYENGMPVKVPLSTAEQNSITVVKYSSSTSETAMPASWFVDRQRNQYDMGIRTGAAALAERGNKESPATDPHQLDVARCCEDGKPSQATQGEGRNNVPDIFERYVRASRSDTQKLMARMVLDDGTALTTNMASGDYNFASSVTLTARPPLSIPAEQLTKSTQKFQERQKYDQFNPDMYQSVTGHFWALPSGLRAESMEKNKTWFYLLGKTSGSQSGWFATRGRAFTRGTTQANARDSVNGGCIQSFSYTMNVATNQFAVSVLKTEGCSWTSGNYSETVVFTITDNYGNRHAYGVTASGDQGSEVSIAAA